MATDPVQEMVHAERASFADYLGTLPPTDWERDSLCAGWRVRDVVAHVIAGAKSTPGAFIRNIVASGFNFDRMNARSVAREVEGTPDELVARLKSVATSNAPPAKALLGEAVVHGEDVRRAVGSPPGEHPADHLRVIADYYKKSGRPLGGRKRIAGLTLRATDADWSTGSGPEVSGPLLSLLLAISGRPAGLVDLSGDGLEALRRRM